MPQIPNGDLCVRTSKLFVKKSHNLRIIGGVFWLGRGFVGVVPPWSGANWTSQLPIRLFQGTVGGGEEGRAMQDILTGCDSWTAAGALRCGKKSQLSRAFGLWCFLGYYWSVSGWVCALRMWNQHGQETLWRLVITWKWGKCSALYKVFKLIYVVA